jgi:hypothetical protein
MKRYLSFVVAVVVLVGVAALLVLPVGCGGGGGSKATAKIAAKTEDPWPKFVTALIDDTDPQTCRQLISELNNGLAVGQAGERPRPAGPEESAAVAAALNLTDGERAAFAQAEYSSGDGNHLAECFYLRDAARSLGVSAADPAAVQATVAFRWLCRQVVLNPWIFPEAQGPTAQPPVPPVFVLRRGSGSGLERAYTFLALCRQLDLDAYLIGRNAADRTWAYQLPGRSNEYPKGPFWAVGVRDGSEILLYDPWRGEPLPGRTPDRPATLAEVRKDPTAVAAWRDDKQTPWDVAAEDLTGSDVYLSVPLSALAPRMGTLAGQMKGVLDGRVAVDWPAAVKAAEAASGGAAVKGWNPRTDRTTPVRGLNWFLPVAQGGLDDTQEVQAQHTKYLVGLIPRNRLIALPGELAAPEARDRLSALSFGNYAAAFQTQPSPREKMQRGRHFEATKQLVEARDRFRRAVGQQPAGGETIERWVQEANRLYAELSKARVADDKTFAVPARERDVEQFWKNTQGPVELILATMIGRPGVAEATYLLALSFHERAEKAEVELNRAWAKTDKQAIGAAHSLAREEWEKAADWWAKYEEFRDEQDASYPDRAAHAKKLAARAAERLEERKKPQVAGVTCP